MKLLKILAPGCKPNRCIFIFFALVLVILACLLDQAQAASWSTEYHGWQVDCSVEHPFLVAWNEFTVKYSTKKDKKEYSWNYECEDFPRAAREEGFPYFCSLEENTTPSDINPSRAALIDLRPGTWNAQEYVCKEIFKRTVIEEIEVW